MLKSPGIIEMNPTYDTPPDNPADNQLPDVHYVVYEIAEAASVTPPNSDDELPLDPEDEILPVNHVANITQDSFYGLKSKTTAYNNTRDIRHVVEEVTAAASVAQADSDVELPVPPVNKAATLAASDNSGSERTTAIDDVDTKDVVIPLVYDVPLASSLASKEIVASGKATKDVTTPLVYDIALASPTDESGTLVNSASAEETLPITSPLPPTAQPPLMGAPTLKEGTRALPQPSLAAAVPADTKEELKAPPTPPPLPPTAQPLLMGAPTAKGGTRAPQKPSLLAAIPAVPADAKEERKAPPTPLPLQPAETDERRDLPLLPSPAAPAAPVAHAEKEEPKAPPTSLLTTRAISVSEAVQLIDGLRGSIPAISRTSGIPLPVPSNKAVTAIARSFSTPETPRLNDSLAEFKQMEAAVDAATIEEIDAEEASSAMRGLQSL